jgi:outer membrane protein assembly factor BamB
MFRHDEAHTGYTNTTAPSTLALLWSAATGGTTYGSPAVADGLVFVGSGTSTGDYMNCYYENNGTLKWRFQTFARVSGGEGLSSSPAYSNGYLYFGGDRIYCLYANNGTVKWTVDTGNTNWGDGTPTIANGKVFIAGSNRKLYCIDQYNGTVIWTFQTLSTGVANYGLYGAPAVVNGRVFLGACDGYLYQIDEIQASSTAVANNTYYTGACMYSSPLVANGRVYIGNGYTYTSTANRFYCFDEVTLSKIWEFYPGRGTGFFSSAAIAYGKLYVGSTDGYLYCLDPIGSGGTTTVIWEYYTGAPIWSSPAVADNKVYIGSQSNFLYCFSAEQTGTPTYLWRFDTGGDVDSSPAISDGKVYVATHGGGGKIYCFGSAVNDISNAVLPFFVIIIIAPFIAFLLKRRRVK